MTEKQDKFQTALAKATNLYVPMVADTLEDNEIEMSDYQRQCVMSAIGVIDELLKGKGKAWQDVNQNSLTTALTNTATMQLNPSASPREVYYITRNKKVNGQWTVEVEMGVEGDGNDALLARFGRDVQTVHKFWEVRENDHFEQPFFDGLQMTPPKWQPTGNGKVIRVVYPITKTNGDVEFVISERESVAKNLKAHINNNLMNETFGIAESRYKANSKQKQEIEVRKKAIVDIFRDMTLEQMLASEALEPYISPAYKDPHSSESMIIRKMRNNAVKKYPKNFENAFLSRVFNNATGEVSTEERRDVTEAPQDEKTAGLLNEFKEKTKKEEPVKETKNKTTPQPQNNEQPFRNTESVEADFEEVDGEEVYRNQKGEVISGDEEVPMTREKVEAQEKENQEEINLDDYTMDEIKKMLDDEGVKYQKSAVRNRDQLVAIAEMALNGATQQDELF